ncbi:MAG: hypothetical protein A2Y12_09235 [Planctomycetes bacterium GWF2_42_9]|nr:MAG: hypothetical protein A2Y12_09235 [Planctomycetes bacterium GWF2_42_9]
MYQPDYNKLRDEAGFNWRVESNYYSLMDLTDITLKELYKNPKAMIELFRKGTGPLKDIFGDDVSEPCLSTPAISYGHVNCIGAELLFPDDPAGEVNHSKPYNTLQEAISLLKVKKEINFAESGMAPFYLEYRNELIKAFDGKFCAFWFSAEGPLTSAYALRGGNIFYDIYDNPEAFKEFMTLLVDSIIDYRRFVNVIHGHPIVNKDRFGLCDDIAAMFGPNLWPEFVIPFINQYYLGLTTGKRHAHIEDLTPDHLPHLETIGIVDYEPSVSAKVNPIIISDRCKIPFHWSLQSFHFPELTHQDVKDWVFRAAANGASNIFITLSDGMTKEPTLSKVKIFIEACKDVKRMLDDGESRETIGDYVSVSGKNKFWSNWTQ